MKDAEHAAIHRQMAETLQELIGIVRLNVTNIAIYNSPEVAERALSRLEKLETQLAEIRELLSHE